MCTLKRLVRQIFTLALILFYLPQKTWTLCSYRHMINLPPEIFKYWGNRGCYSYMRPDLFVDYPLSEFLCEIKFDNKLYNVSGIDFKGCIPFDLSNEVVLEAVKKTFKTPLTMEKLIDCSLDAMKCCLEVMDKTVIEENHCPPVWDGWSCFPSVRSGEVSEQVCSRHAYAGEPPRCHHFSYKECYINNSWKDRTDYSNCDITPNLKFRTNWHISTLVVSILVCSPAALALITLNSQKLSVIRNLVFSIIIRDFFLILVKSIIIIDELTSTKDTVMSENNGGCKFLTFLEKLSGNAVFACMLLEGIYLHQLLTNAFRSRQNGGVKLIYFYIASGILATGTAIAWAAVMATQYDENCWQVTEGTNFNWILTAPRLLMLVINAILLSHIVWTLWNTFRSKHGEHYGTMRTVKAALICLPLFGVPFFLMVVHPNTNSCELEQFYYIASYTIEALQGICIVTLHCYREREVKKVFMNFYGYVKDLWNKKIGQQNSFTESIPSEKQFTVRSNLGSTENKIADLQQKPSEDFLKNNTQNISEDHQGVSTKARSSDKPDLMAENKNTPDETTGIESNQNNKLIKFNCEISFNPTNLFKSEGDDVILPDSNTKK